MIKILCTCLLCLASPLLAQAPIQPSWTIAVGGVMDGYTTTVCVQVDQLAPVCQGYVAMTQHFAIDVPNVGMGTHTVVVTAQNPRGGASAEPVTVQAEWPLPTVPTDIHATAILVVPVPVAIVPDQP